MISLILTIIAFAILATMIGIITFIAFACVIIQEFSREVKDKKEKK